MRGRHQQERPHVPLLQLGQESCRHAFANVEAGIAEMAS